MTVDWHRHIGPDFLAHYNALSSLLRAVPGLAGGIHLGAVSDPRSDGEGRVLPYVVIWPGTGTPIQDESLSGVTYQAAQQAEFTTTVVAGAPQWLVPAARDVTHTLTDALGGRVKPNVLQQRSAVMAQSQAERPVRYFSPLAWTITDHS